MKKAIRIISIALVIIIVGTMLASCSKMLSGTYTASIGGDLAGLKTSYTFSGNRVTKTTTGSLIGSSSTTEIKGKYEIKEATDGTQSITFTFESDGSTTTSTETFSEGKDDNGAFVVIGGVTYYKK